jgi:hypothetical protein
MAAPDAFWDVPFNRRSSPVGEDGGGPQPTVITIEDDGNVIPFPSNNSENIIHITRTEDGGAVVDLSEGRTRGPANDDEFSSNLAEMMDDLELGRLSEDLLEGIDADLRSREEWVDNRDRAVDLLGMKIEKPRTGPGGAGAPLSGMSTAKDPSLLEAVIRGQANAIGEFLPAEGPAKIEDIGDQDQDELAQLLEKDFNYYMTDVATEYYTDTKQMFAWVYFGGSGFKKAYHCPLRKRPVSESVDAKDLVVSNAATDLMNADRVTHIIEMRKSEFKRMAVAGFYMDDVATTAPTMRERNRLEQKLESIEGVRADSTRPEDQPYTIYECRCECEFEFDRFVPRKFKKHDVPLPYSVSIEKDSRRIVAIYRDWKQEDEECNRRRTFVKFSYIDWMGFYGIGLLHIIGNLTMALTAMLRIAIDNGMFSNFPGGLAAKLPGQKQGSNELIAGPGQYVGIDMQGLDDIRKVVMQMPYTDIKQGFLVLIEKVREFVKSVGGSADLPVGEGRADIPVGTILAMIEQATKVESAVHKGMHRATAEEFELIIDLLREDPAALFRYQKKAKRRGGTSTWDEAKVLQALNDYDLVPRSDPNTPSHLHRIMKAAALWQMAQSAPGVFNLVQIATQILEILGFKDTQKYLAPPQTAPAQPSPEQITANAKMIEAQTKQGEAQTKAASSSLDPQIKLAEIQASQDVANTNLAKELVIHGSDQANAQADRDLKKQNLGLQAMKTHADLGLKGEAHRLNLRSHALDAASAAHDAAMDVAGGINKPNEAAG